MGKSKIIDFAHIINYITNKYKLMACKIELVDYPAINVLMKQDAGNDVVRYTTLIQNFYSTIGATDNSLVLEDGNQLLWVKLTDETGAFLAKNNINSIRVPTEPINPNSSETIAKIKSVCGSGR